MKTQQKKRENVWIVEFQFYDFDINSITDIDVHVVENCSRTVKLASLSQQKLDEIVDKLGLRYCWKYKA